MPESKKLSEHFNLREFHSKDGREVPEEYEDALEYLCREILEPLRAKFGPCTVHSGYRSQNHNRRVGGARMSFHVYEWHDKDDVAADISFRKGTVRQWHAAAEALLERKRNGKGGLGFYPQGGFIHIDTRDYEARWNGS